MPVPSGTKLIHCHLYLNGHSLTMKDPMPEHAWPLEAQQGCTLTLIVDDIDSWFKRAVDAGCEVITPVAIMFWGDRFAALRHPFGVSWAMNAPAKWPPTAHTRVRAGKGAPICRPRRRPAAHCPDRWSLRLR